MTEKTVTRVIVDECVGLDSASFELARALLVVHGSVPTSPSNAAVATLLRGLASVKVYPCVKGRFFEAMESKLRQLSHGRSNEVVAVDFADITQSLKEIERELPCSDADVGN